MSTSTLSMTGLNKLERNLVPHMQAAIPHILTYLKQLAIQIVVRVGAIDTLSLLFSIYISAWRYSEYEEAMNEAADAYSNNPTKYPEIRRIMGGRLEELPELKPRNANEGWLGVGAKHGIAVEEGYKSFYGNEIPARPFVHDTAAEGVPIVLREFQAALRKALA